MSKEESDFVDVSKLRMGMYVELGLGWIAHPFPTSSFTITTEKQIATIQSMGLGRVRVNTALSSLAAFLPDDAQDQEPQGASSGLETIDAQAISKEVPAQPISALSQQRNSLVVCERRFAAASRQYRKTLERLPTEPKVAAQECVSLVGGLVTEMLSEGESAIRLLSDTTGDRSSMHAVNVTVMSLLLGRAMGLQSSELVDLGVAAFLHDVGKTELPERARWLDESFSTAEYKVYQDHVAKSVVLGKAMELSKGALLAIAQHHELVDGSGFPMRAKSDTMSPISRILALVNRFEGMCNPARVGGAMTPHDALATLFSQMKSKFDTTTLSAFIRMMGVYPPGSVVQLIDERYALVVSVNSARPLKPCIIVHEAGVAREEALMVDLEFTPHIGIRRSIKPTNLPSASLEYLAPRQKVSYFFEKSSDPSTRHAIA